MKKIYIRIAGFINLITALIHLFAGQLDLVYPLYISNLKVQQKAEWIGVWHLATILLLYSSFMILKAGFGKLNYDEKGQIKSFGILYILMGIPFIISSIYFGVLAPQWILLIAIGTLLLYGVKGSSNIVE